MLLCSLDCVRLSTKRTGFFYYKFYLWFRSDLKRCTEGALSLISTKVRFSGEISVPQLSHSSWSLVYWYAPNVRWVCICVVQLRWSCTGHNWMPESIVVCLSIINVSYTDWILSSQICFGGKRVLEATSLMLEFIFTFRCTVYLPLVLPSMNSTLLPLFIFGSRNIFLVVNIIIAFIKLVQGLLGNSSASPFL
jgi:hypothetical protein